MGATYSSIKDFVNHYQNESPSTLKLLQAVSDQNADSEPTPGVRSTRRLSWHLANSPGEFGKQIGLSTTVYAPSDKPSTMAGIAEVYTKAADEFLSIVQKELSDSQLNDEINAWGVWKTTKGEMLYLLVSHEIHHRGQLQVTMRTVGDMPVGVLGPTAEEEKAMMG